MKSHSPVAIMPCGHAPVDSPSYWVSPVKVPNMWVKEPSVHGHGVIPKFQDFLAEASDIIEQRKATLTVSHLNLFTYRVHDHNKIIVLSS